MPGSSTRMDRSFASGSMASSTFNNSYAMIDAALNGYGIAYLPEDIVDRHIDVGRSRPAAGRLVAHVCRILHLLPEPASEPARVQGHRRCAAISEQLDILPKVVVRGRQITACVPVVLMQSATASSAAPTSVGGFRAAVRRCPAPAQLTGVTPGDRSSRSSLRAHVRACESKPERASHPSHCVPIWRTPGAPALRVSTQRHRVAVECRQVHHRDRRRFVVARAG